MSGNYMDVSKDQKTTKSAVRFYSVNDAVVAADQWVSPIHSVRHIVQDKDGMFKIMGHINCEHCRYCDEKMPNLGERHLITGVHVEPEPFLLKEGV